MAQENSPNISIAEVERFDEQQTATDYSERLLEAGSLALAEIGRDHERALAIVEARYAAYEAKIEKIESIARETIERLTNQFTTLTRRMEDAHRQSLELFTAQIAAGLAALKDGAPGPAGPQGERGEKGEQGPRGERGEQGERGQPGPQGEPGVDGDDGIDGADGRQGAPGERGERGERGLVGPPGRQGERGEQGERGLDGKPGERGLRGERGERGMPGRDGMPGRMGEPGKAGARGEKGERGEDGKEGPPGREGVPGPSGAKGDQGISGADGAPGAAGEPGQRGAAGDRGETGPIGPAGRDGAPGERGEKGESGPRGERGLPGMLTAVRQWDAERPSYASELITHGGSLWQAVGDTVKEPREDSPDWRLLACRGEDGRSMGPPQGLYDPKASYRACDTVTLNGSWFAAVRDDPGPCPGDGWRVGPSGRKGERGDRGEAGTQGEPGKAGRDGRDGRDAPTIRGWQIDEKKFVAIPLMSDGTQGPPLELRSLFQRFLDEVR